MRRAAAAPPAAVDALVVRLRKQLADSVATGGGEATLLLTTLKRACISDAARDIGPEQLVAALAKLKMRCTREVAVATIERWAAPDSKYVGGALLLVRGCATATAATHDRYTTTTATLYTTTLL